MKPDAGIAKFCLATCGNRQREKYDCRALNYDNFAVLAIAALQEQQKRIERLEQEAAAKGKLKQTKKPTPAKKKGARSSR